MSMLNYYVLFLVTFVKFQLCYSDTDFQNETFPIQPESNRSIEEFFARVNQNYEYEEPDVPAAENENVNVECFGFRKVMSYFHRVINLKPQTSSEINTKFYFSSRSFKEQIQISDCEYVDRVESLFKYKNPTVVIIHGYMSKGNASWVKNMTEAFLNWGDVNVIAVDWSGGGRTWKYWRAVANTRTVGSDITNCLKILIEKNNASKDNFHLIGHSLGAHICSFIANKLGGVKRITGLDPAQPCFKTGDANMILDKSDADFVDVIHTNGRGLSKFGLGVKRAYGHQDFYPNGGLKQPACHKENSTLLSKILPISKAKLKRAKCDHAQAHLFFTESLKNHDCSLTGHLWDLSYSSINSSLSTPCTKMNCAELGIRAVNSPARGTFYVMTTNERPYCEKNPVKVELRTFLLKGLQDE